MSKKETINTALAAVYHHPLNVYLNHSYVLHDISINESSVTCTFNEIAGSFEINALKPQIENAIFAIEWVSELNIKLNIKKEPQFERPNGLKNVSTIIAVSSCKGGVGKSTIALNLATAFHLNGARVGVFDADIHGPSLPTLLSPSGLCDSDSDMSPFVSHGIKLMSYGYIQTNHQQPAILRGPIASNILKQLLINTDWGQLDILVIDCPPGTGDILISLTQEIQLDSAIIVTTPHELSYVDVKKGIEMFSKVNVPMSCLIENMSYFQNPDTQEKYNIFGRGRLIPTAKAYGIPLWLDLPINQTLSSYLNKKTPYLFTASPDEVQVYKTLANNVAWEIKKSKNATIPKTTYNNKLKVLELTANKNSQSIGFVELRKMCQCAYCVDELTGQKNITSTDIDNNIAISKLFNVGRYAIGIEWNEHQTTHQSMFPLETIYSSMDKVMQ